MSLPYISPPFTKTFPWDLVWRKPEISDTLPICLSIEFSQPFDPVDLQFDTFSRFGLESVPTKGRAWQPGRRLDLSKSLAGTGFYGTRGNGHVAH